MLYFKDTNGKLRQVTFGNNTRDIAEVQNQNEVKQEINKCLVKTKVNSPVLAVVK